MRKSLFALLVLMLSLFLASSGTNAQTMISLGGSSCLSCLGFKVSGSALGAAMSPQFVSSAAFASGALPSPEMTAFTLPEGRAHLLNSSAENRDGDFGLRLASSGTTMLGFLRVQSPLDFSDDRHADRTFARDFDFDGGGSCAVAGARCDAGFDRIHLILSPFEPPRARHHHHHHHGFDPPDGDGGSLPPPSISTAPEPMSMLLFGTGLLVLGGTLRRRQQRIES